MDPRFARGPYIAMIGGCNDGHTARFAESGGNVPESDRFTGSALGHSGPWGTTFASNLHIAIGSMTLENWRSYARQAMPFLALNQMTQDDLDALRLFTRSLGKPREPAPMALPPGVEPPLPSFRLMLPTAPQE